MRRRNILAGGAATAAALGAGLFHEKKKLDGAYDFAELRAPDGVPAWVKSMAELDGDAVAAAGSVVHVGQSTHLLSIAGKRILTDPWFYDPSFGALSHKTGPAVAPDAVGRLDLILITHDHPDHADPRALDRLDKRATVIVATKELVSLCRRLGYTTVILLEPWQGIPALPGVSVDAVPGLHDIYEIGYVVKGAGHSVYFAGDSRLHKDLPAIAERHAPTTAILSVDGTRLIGSKDLWVMTPEDAVQAAQILKVKNVMPSHADTYFSDGLVRNLRLATDIQDAKPQFEKKVAAMLPGVTCINPRPGERASLGSAAI